MRLYRVIVPVPNIDQAASYYESLLGLPGKRDTTMGERSFYLQDPFGNPLCMVDQNTLFTG